MYQNGQQNYNQQRYGQPQQGYNPQYYGQPISPEQVAQATQVYYQRPMTMEELQRTQVLNFDDFRETTRIEKLSSQRPAKILASLGAFLIVLGMMFPMLQSNANSNSNAEFREQTNKTPVVEDEKKEDTSIKDLTCRKEMLNNPNGTDEILNVYYTFTGGKLTAYSKEYLLRKSATATTEPGELASYLAALEPFLAVQVPGYTLSVQQLENGSITKSIVDYATLEYASIPDMYQNNYRFDVPFTKDAAIDQVQAGLEGIGYYCE